MNFYWKPNYAPGMRVQLFTFEYHHGGHTELSLWATHCGKSSPNMILCNVSHIEGKLQFAKHSQHD